MNLGDTLSRLEQERMASGYGQTGLPFASQSIAELEARRMQEAFGNAEFEHEVAATMGPLGQQAIDADIAHLTPNPMIIQQENGRRGRQWAEWGNADRDLIFAHGPEAWNPQIWAHEFRHRAFPNLSEEGNRLVDAYIAGDLPPENPAYSTIEQMIQIAKEQPQEHQTDIGAGNPFMDMMRYLYRRDGMGKITTPQDAQIQNLNQIGSQQDRLYQEGF